MSSNVMKTVCLCALLALALALGAAPADGKAVQAEGQEQGLLSTLISLAKTPAALGSSEETEQEDIPPSDGDTTKAVKPAGERGIHKKKLWYYHIWNVFYWYLWVFAAVAIKFKIAFLIIWGHLTYFLVALIRVLIREVPLWVQLKREPVPVYGPPPPQYGPQYGPTPPQYGSNSYATSSYAAPFKRRLGDTPQAHQQAQQATTGAQELAYAGHRK